MLRYKRYSLFLSLFLRCTRGFLSRRRRFPEISFPNKGSIRSCNGETCVGLNVYVTGLHDRFRGSSSSFREGEYQCWKPLIGFPLVFIRITLPNLASITFPSKRVKGDASRVVFHDVYLIPLVRYEESSKSWRAWWCWWCQRWGLLAWTKNEVFVNFVTRIVRF